MLRISLAIAILALIGCGGQETTPGAASDAASETGAAAATQVQRCVGLMDQEAYARALPVCLEALELEPQNREVRAAVDRAKAEVASLEKAKADAEQAAAEAAEDASSRLDEATQGLPRE
jgi:hypothetical protein